MKKIIKSLLVVSVLVFIAASCNPLQKKTEVQQQNITVSQNVEKLSTLQVFNYQASEKKTALDMLKASHEVKTKSFGDAGEFVEAINGTAPDAKHFWAFYVNGQSSNVGAGSYELKDGDSIEWKLEEIK